MPREVRGLVRQAAISAAALERANVDDSAWIVRAICEKLGREWDGLGLDEALPESVRRLGALAPRNALRLVRPAAGA